MLETGYVRRCLFGFGQQNRKAFTHHDSGGDLQQQNPAENNNIISKWSDRFHDLADPSMLGWRMTLR